MGNIKVLGYDFATVGDLMNALSNLDPDTPLYPFGTDRATLIYVNDEETAYLDDNFDWLSESEFDELWSQIG